MIFSSLTVHIKSAGFFPSHMFALHKASAIEQLRNLIFCFCFHCVQYEKALIVSLPFWHGVYILCHKDNKSFFFFFLARLGIKACLILFPRNDIYRIINFLNINAGYADKLFWKWGCWLVTYLLIIIKHSQNEIFSCCHIYSAYKQLEDFNIQGQLQK